MDHSDRLGRTEAATRTVLSEAIDDPAEASPRLAALAAMGQIAGILEDGERRPAEPLLRACGEADWLVTHTAAFMIDARARMVTPSGDVDSGA